MWLWLLKISALERRYAEEVQSVMVVIRLSSNHHISVVKKCTLNMMGRPITPRAIGILVLSAILFVMPIGAIFANSSMTAPVLAAEDTDGGSTDESGAASDNNSSEDNGSDESGDVRGS